MKLVTAILSRSSWNKCCEALCRDRRDRYYGTEVKGFGRRKDIPSFIEAPST